MVTNKAQSKSKQLEDPPHGLVVFNSTMFEVLWNGKSVGCYNTEQEAENVAEN